MTRLYLKNTLGAVLLWLCASGFSLAAGSSGQYELDSLLQQMIRNNPAVLKAQQSLVQADEQMQLVQSALRPMVTGGASYTRVGPISKFDLPGIGEAELNPADNISAGINYEQTLYDFGRTGKLVAVEQARKLLLNESIEQLQEQLSLKLINSYFQVVFLQNAIEINDEEMATLQEHKQTVTKKLDAGTSTKYELLSTQVRISKLKSKRVDLEALRTKELAVLSTLVGLDFDSQVKFPEELSQLLVQAELGQALEQAFANSDQIKIAKEQENIASLQANAIHAQVNPSISALATVGVKNGFEPDIQEIRPNFTVGVGVQVPIYSASKTKHQLALQQAKQEELRYATESAKQGVKQEVIQSIEDLKAAKLKIEQVEMQFEQANEGYRLAEVSFRSGTITNLDLLDASTNLEDSKLELIKTKIDYLLAGYQLKHATGEKLYQ
ncbi:TolC family protein [Mangrovibacterium lignilyticum]|uniref:TolC family protein n=1 Tax=Mangrovibacterium lignilyticum TaxID=2668052 RepID=UPI0013D396DD|nr:TolC family protein [Mangrovibacterium lignilyticum]